MEPNSITSKNVCEEFSEQTVAHHFDRAGAKHVSLRSQHTLPIKGLRVDVLQIETLSIAEFLGRTLGEDGQEPLNLLHKRRKFEKKASRLDVRLWSPRQKFRFLNVFSKEVNGQQVCTGSDHARVASAVKQQHESLSGKFAHCVDMVHEQSVQRLWQNPAVRKNRAKPRYLQNLLVLGARDPLPER